MGRLVGRLTLAHAQLQSIDDELDTSQPVCRTDGFELMSDGRELGAVVWRGSRHDARL